MSYNFDQHTRSALFQYLLRLADDRLILGHRLSEWCGHGPILEEDIALSNFALDFIGQAEALLRLAGEVEGKGRSEDDLAYKRDWQDYHCCQLVERPKGDFGFTMARQFFFDAYDYPMWEALTTSSFEPLAAIAGKSVKEAKYHLRHSGEWMLRLGDGTQESHDRVQHSVDSLWRYTGELFDTDDIHDHLFSQGIAICLSGIEKEWKEIVEPHLQRATLSIPSEEGVVMVSGTRYGAHSEHLGHLLTEMQVLPRAYPDAKW
ncbi:MAG: phenylacetate-CoA oxygenase subunit PaaC [Bdellovibrionales bacterium]|nr:phenylacetate-CoA oxygenase subunit PaaC [Bdellovibrionales bacterium]